LLVARRLLIWGGEVIVLLADGKQTCSYTQCVNAGALDSDGGWDGIAENRTLGGEKVKGESEDERF